MDIRTFNPVGPALGAALGGAPVGEGLTGGAGVGGLFGGGKPVGDAGSAFGGFGDALHDAISTLDRLQKDADGKAFELATGGPVEIHEVMLAQDRASLGFQLAVQVRNKLVEAYQDVMRIQL